MGASDASDRYSPQSSSGHRGHLINNKEGGIQHTATDSSTQYNNSNTFNGDVRLLMLPGPATFDMWIEDGDYGKRNKDTKGKRPDRIYQRLVINLNAP